MIRQLFLFLFIALSFSVVNAQSNAGLVRYFSFDNCDGVDNGSAGINAILQNGPQCGCGVSGNGLEFDGVDDAVIIPGTESTFNTVDFSVSFFYKSESGASQDILSRKEFCDNNNAFSIRAVPGSNTIITQMMENTSKGTLWNTPLDQSNCWHHVVFIRDGDFHLLYLDGELVEEQTTVTRTDISNPNIQLEISGGACLGIQDLGFKGTIDELRIYNRALRDFEIDDLGLSIDEIITPDTLIFLGNSVDIISSNSCATGFSWFPTNGVDIDSDPNTTITPSQTTVYNLQYAQGTCISTDSIRISVIDPSTLDCTELFMANAFTPNGDSRNDAFGISNPFAIEEFVSFEILDKWGNRVYFNDSDVDARWNGVFKGSLALPGVYLYRVLWKCGGEEQVRTGSVTLIR